MTLSFAERRVQARTLANVSFWLNPHSRAFDTSIPTITIEVFEKLCGPIQDTRFDAKLVEDVFSSALDMAEGLIVEHAILRNCKLSEFKAPPGYSLVSRLPNGDPGKELDLTLTVLQTIIKSNEDISSRAEIKERLEKLIEAKADLDKDKPDAPELLSIHERIDNCDAIGDEEIQEFIDQIEKDNSYHNHISIFGTSPHLLKGLRHLQFLQNAYANTATVNKSFYDVLLKVAENVIGRLSSAELETALTSSSAHFAVVLQKKRDFLTDLKTALDCEKSGLVFTSRLLLCGPKKCCDDLTTLLNDRAKDDDGRFRSNFHKDSTGIKKICVAMLRDLPPVVFKMLLEGDRPCLLKHLFASQSPFVHEYFRIPITLLILSGVMPLNDLLKPMLKGGQAMRGHFYKLFHCFAIKAAIEKVSSEHLEETTTSLIACMAIVACPELSVDGTIVGDVLLQLMKKSGEESSTTREWLCKYEDGEKIADWAGLGKKGESEALWTEETVLDASELVTGNDEEAKEDEKKEEEEGEEKALSCNKDDDKEKKKGDEETEQDREMREDEEDATQSEDEEGETDIEKKEEDGDGLEKEDTAEPAEEESEKTDQASKQLEDELAADVVEEVIDKFVTACNVGSEDVVDDEVAVEKEKADSEQVTEDLVDAAEEEKADSEQVSEDLVDSAVTEEENVSDEKASEDLVCGAITGEEKVPLNLAGEADVKEDAAAIDQAASDPSAAPASTVDDDQIYPDGQEELMFSDETEGEEEMEQEEEEVDDERLAATQSSTVSQEVDGFANSIEHIDDIEGI